MDRPPNKAEQDRLKAFFPNMDVTQIVITGEIDYNYNCLSWTEGITTTPLWPGPSLAEFDTFYRKIGFSSASNGPIAAYGSSDSEMAHAAISGNGHGPRWESKYGTDVRFQHSIGDIEGSSYGRVRTYYCLDSSIVVSDRVRNILRQLAREKPVKSYFSKEQRAAMELELHHIPEPDRMHYHRAFADWRASWARGGLSFFSNPHTRAAGPEFQALIAMGSKIIPLVVATLADPANYFALQLYDCIQTDPKLLVQFTADDDRILEGETGRARRTVQAWHSNR